MAPAQRAHYILERSVVTQTIWPRRWREKIPRRGFIQSLARAQLELIENPTDAHAATEIALLCARYDELPRGIRRARWAITLSCSQARPELALAVYRCFPEERAGLNLKPGIWEALGRMLLREGSHTDAAWCLHAGALAAKDALAAEKRLIEVANAAADAGKVAEALQLFHQFLQTYPRSNFVTFVENRAAQLRKRQAG